MKTRVALVIDKFDPKMGGAERYVWELAHVLKTEGMDVHILTRLGIEAGIGIKIHYIRTVRHPKFLRLLGFVRGVKKELKDGNYDIVHGVGYNTGVTLLNPHTGVEQSWIEGDDESRESVIGRLWGKVRRALSPRGHLILKLQKEQYRDKGVRAIIAISDMVKEDIMRFHDVDEGRIRVIYNGVDTERFHPKNREIHREEMREAVLGIDSDEILILMVTNNFRLKGVFPAIGVLPVLKEMAERPIRLIIVGRDSPKRYLAYARRLGVLEMVDFIEHVEDMAPIYAAADIFFHPTFYDSCSLVVLEALASGLPVVTTRKNGAAGVIDSREVGWVVSDPRDREELARAVAHYFPDETRKKALDGARRIVEDITSRENFNAIKGVYEEIISRNAKVRFLGQKKGDYKGSYGER